MLIFLFRHFQNKKEFSSFTAHKSGVEDLSGVASLSDYQTLEKTDSYIEEMKGYGLTEEEILLKLQHEEPQQSVRETIIMLLNTPMQYRQRFLQLYKT